MRDKKVKLTILAILIIVLSYFRDHVFHAINEQIRLNYYHEPAYRYSFLQPALSLLETSLLEKMKFPATFIFCLIFMLLCILTTRAAFKERIYQKYVLLAYPTLFALAFLIYLTGNLIGHETQAYELSRNISEFLQSPLLIIILISVFFFDRKQRSLKRTEN